MVDTLVEPAAKSRLLATFSVGGAHFALSATTVQEVIRVDSVTPVRHAPPEVAGVMNLRGKIVTLLDLGSILAMGKIALTHESRVFIVEDRGEFLGILVDRVHEVIEVESHEAEPLPVNIPVSQAGFLEGVFRTDGKVLAVLNLGEVLNEVRH